MTQARALSILKTGANVFLTGEPGAGKTYTINEYVHYLHEHDIDVAICASTGIAATHIGGMTIHSWSGIGIKTSLDKYALDKIASSEYISKRVNRAKVLIIDEVSMLHANMLDMVDAVCREVRSSSDPFGGLQVIFVGDFFQLPPVVRNTQEAGNDDNQTLFIDDEKPNLFAYQSSAWRRATPIVCYLSEQYRQDDTEFLSILSAIRSDSFNETHLAHIQSRKLVRTDLPKDTPKLFSHNVDVDRVNTGELTKIKADQKTFEMSATGKDILVSILKKGCLSPEILTLKVGASVMFTKNNQKDGFVNGTLGTVEGFAPGTNYPIVKTRTGRKIIVEPMDWALEENGKVKAQISQIPLRLAWAITVHKSQGMSMDAAVMDLSEVFEYGQGYVALSRVRRLSGLHILGWNERTFKVHPDVLVKDEDFHIKSEEAEEAFAKIPAPELQKMQNNFITASGGILKANTEYSLGKKKIDTKDKTLDLWNEGKTIAEIAETRELSEQTIFGHIEDLVTLGKITNTELSRLVTPKLSKSLSKIQAVFKKLDTEKLTPVFENLGGKYSYDDIRIARMLLNK